MRPGWAYHHLMAKVNVGKKIVRRPKRAGILPRWSYSGPCGPAHWGELADGFAPCKDGRRQSPIDIRRTRLADLPPIRFRYQPFALRIINTGRSVQINAGSGGSISVGKKRYRLLQFHFHKPSEEKIRGKRLDMVIHLVHQDAKGNLAVVAVLLKKGKPNTFIQALWDHLPPAERVEHAPANVKTDAAGILPRRRSYYTYGGSLTTPPCTEGVTWYILKSPVEISAAQIAVFGKFYPNNARPTQPVNGREILESK
jgi:carbonic anhydrase